MNDFFTKGYLKLHRPTSFFTPSPMKTLRLITATKARNTFITKRFKIINTGRLELHTAGVNRFGTAFYGFQDGTEPSLIRVRGSLSFEGSVTVAAGARWDIGPDAVVTIGSGTYFSPDTMLIAMHDVRIGEGCAIGWNVQILDSDFHTHGYKDELGRFHSSENSAPIEIGNHVWVGSHAKIFKGVSIAPGCIIAGNSTVTRSIEQPNSLVAGSPARIVKSNVEWT